MMVVLSNDQQRKVDCFMESQLVVSMFMADNLDRWLYEHDGKLLKVTDLVTGNSITVTTNEEELLSEDQKVKIA